MKLMVVDDNKQVREGISLGIDWKEYGICEVRAYEDGADAEKELKAFKPDIIIADIRMPNMDGLELLEKVRKDNARCRYILLSAYSDFSYAQKALQLGANDYILKPVKPRELVEVVMKNITCLLEMQKESDLYYEIYEKSFLHQIWSGEKISNHEKFQEFMRKKYKMDFSENCVLVGKIILNPRNFKIQEKPIEEELVAEIVNLLLENGYASKTGTNGTIMILRVGNRSELMNHTIIFKIRMELEMINQKYCNVTVMAGLSKCYGIGNLAEGWKEAGEALEQSYYRKNEVFFVYEYLENSMHMEIPESWKKNCMEKLQEAVKTKNKEEITAIFEEIYEESAERKYSVKKMKKFVQQIYFYLVQHAGVETSWEFEEILYSELCLEDLIEKFTEYLFNVQGNSSSAEKAQYSALVRNICVYVEEHFMESLTVEFLAEKYNRTPNYISAKFKRETGKSFTDYLIEIRIRKAMNMLLYTNIPINEIARKTGFGSYTYFSRIFKKCVGKSAGSIRERK